MKVSIAASCMILALLVAGCRPGEAPGSDAHAPPEAAAPEAMSARDGHAGHSPAPALPAGQLWATDVPLRTAMSRIRNAVEQALPAYEQGSLEAAPAQALAAAIESDVSYMVKNCKLEPEPDAALHALIGRMMGAAVALRADPGSPDGVPQLAAVLHDYGASFDHPAWTQLPDAHP